MALRANAPARARVVVGRVRVVVRFDGVVVFIVDRDVFVALRVLICLAG